MSPRAACRLETLGFSAVYDYTAGKADWLAAGLPTDGPGSAAPRPGRLARTEIPICELTDTVATARALVEASRETRCVVLSDTGIVLGTVVGRALAGEGSLPVGEVMRSGPVTVRANEDLAVLVERMTTRTVTSMLVTDPDGRLIGSLHCADGGAALADARATPGSQP
jgi:hypothetical protein